MKEFGVKRKKCFEMNFSDQTKISSSNCCLIKYANEPTSWIETSFWLHWIQIAFNEIIRAEVYFAVLNRKLARIFFVLNLRFFFKNFLANLNLFHSIMLDQSRHKWKENERLRPSNGNILFNELLVKHKNPRGRIPSE